MRWVNMVTKIVRSSELTVMTSVIVEPLDWPTRSGSCERSQSTL